MKKRSKTIAIFSGYHIPHLGGIERYTQNLSKQLIEKGYKVIIVSSNYSFDKEYIKEENNLVYIKLPVYKLFVTRYPIPRINKIYKNIINYFKTLNIDKIIVNTRFHLTSLVGAKFGYKNNIDVYLIEHGSNHLTIDNKVLDFFGEIYEHILTKYIKKYIKYYYGVSKEACNWQKHFKINSNGVWYNSINDFSKNYKIKKEDKKINIMYAGRILKQKGIIELISCFNKLSKKYKNIYLHIAGDGNLLEHLINENKNKKIKFYGKLDFNNLCKLYAKNDIFVYYSKYPEGLPTSILEAGLMENAVIASDQNCIKEIIVDNKTGIIAKTENELLNKLEFLILNKENRIKLSKKLKSKVINNFEWNKTSNKIIKDLESVK